jgi:hypothetical protein
MEYHSTIKKNDIVICRKMDGTGNHHVKQNKQNKPGSDRQMLRVFSHMWEIYIGMNVNVGLLGDNQQEGGKGNDGRI